jgi:MoxR-like ATPase
MASVSDFEITMNEMSITEAHKLIMVYPKPVMLWGAPGIGKSQGLESLSQEQNFGLYVWSAGVAEPTDVGGIPFQTDKGYADYLVTKYFWECTTHPDVPKDKQGPAILFLDDLVTAHEQVQNACYHLLDSSRQVGNLKLRDNVKVVCAGNRIDDGC